MHIAYPTVAQLRQQLSPRKDWLLVLAGAVIALAGVETASLIYRAQTPLRYQPAGITITWLPATVTRWRTPIDDMAKKYNLDPNLVAIIMTLESGGDAKATSGSDAHGLMQVTSLTAQDIAAKYLKQPVTKYDLTDPHTNIEFGVAYLAYLRREFGDINQAPSWQGTVELVAAGYNGGPGAAHDLATGQGLTDTQTVVYSRDAYNMWRERAASTSPTYTRWLERGGSNLIKAAQAD